MNTQVQVQDNRTAISVSIANGESLSGAVYLGGLRLVGIVMPSTWTTANLSIQASYDGETYQELYDDAGDPVTLTTGQAQNIGLTSVSSLTLLAFPYIKIRSGASGAAVNQGGARTIVLIGVPS